MLGKRKRMEIVLTLLLYVYNMLAACLVCCVICLAFKINYNVNPYNISDCNKN